MKEEDIRRIEAWFDGEGLPDDVLLVEDLLQADSAAQGYLAELKKSRELLKLAHPETPSPVSWEQLRANRRQPVAAESRKVVSFPRMISAAAAIIIIGMALWYPIRQAGMKVSTARALISSVEFVETDLVGATPVVYLDQPSGWTVVWVVEDSGQPDI